MDTLENSMPREKSRLFRTIWTAFARYRAHHADHIPHTMNRAVGTSQPACKAHGTGDDGAGAGGRGAHA